MQPMRIRDRAVVTLADVFGWQHPHFVYRRRDTSADGGHDAGRIVKFWLLFIAPFAGAFVVSVLFAIGEGLIGA